MQTVKWWQNAVIYHILPRSFMDTTGDGEGDLNGIISKLDYICALGVDAIWMCPIYESPREDLGYDPTDLRNIDPVYGNLDDFDRLVSLAQARGLKVFLDQIWSHTSHKHPWFLESRENRTNAKADWYIWADANPDGTPPNNWLSAFGGSAWAWCPEREQFYMHNFLKSQPDLNWHNPEVIDAVFDEARFWLERGVDGFRLDAVNFYIHDPELRNNPVRSPDAPIPEGVSMRNPFARQLFVYNFCRPETIDYLTRIRQLVAEYGVITLGEVTLCEDSVALAAEYTAGDEKLHLAYNSALLFEEPMTASRIRHALERVIDKFQEDDGMCWMVGNHDYGRLRSCWTGQDEQGNPYPDEFYQMMAGVLVSLPGAFCLYQGDELGLPVARIPEDIPVEAMQDPFGKELYPAIQGRDGSRTPIPWVSDASHAGFTTGEQSWLPIPKSHLERAVNIEDNEPNSLLNTWRRLLHWRKGQPAMMHGNCEIIETSDPLFGFIRETEEQKLLCLFNMSNEPIDYDLSAYDTCRPFRTPYLRKLEIKDKKVHLPGYGAFFGSLLSVSEKSDRLPFSPPVAKDVIPS